MTDMLYDLFVIGGGINGCGIARDAAGRGLKVFLAERNDLASATSSASTKLIHGGLRYLEHYEFRLVREALVEREVLLRAAPHIIWPLRFVLPHHSGLRPWPILRLGLFLYDHLGGRKILPGTRTIRLAEDPIGAPLKPQFSRGYEYSDCWVDDARLVVLNARDAARRGATIRTRCQVTRARRVDGHWQVEIAQDGQSSTIAARALANVSGPWASQVLGSVVGHASPDRIRMVKGSHLVVDRLYDHDRCFIFQNTDGRICFTIPYEGKFTLIGTTDQDYQGDPRDPAITEEETDYLLAAVSEYLRRPVTHGMIRWSYAGVRPLYDDGASKAQEATRDYVLKLDETEGAPLLTVFGGKITTYRKLAEAVLARLAPHLPAARAAWTVSEHLPGGDFPYAEVSARLAEAQQRYAFLAPDVVRRMFRCYGTDIAAVLGDARGAADLGRDFGLISEREIVYLKSEEWARTADDVLWRRSKLGLHLSPADAAALRAFMS
jgi:glycerol-3-phosphate dehydrogenase